MSKGPIGALMLIAVFLLIPLSSVSPLDPDPSQQTSGRQESVDDLLVCDCVVMKTRRMGPSRPPILARQAPFRTTVGECKKRGGRYVLYSSSDKKAALDIWLPAAKEGNAEAQYSVGEIYERGLGVEPDYAEAARWYGLAADQGYKAAQNSLGHLFERGLGVEKSPELALRWYRKASRNPDAILLSAPPEGEPDSAAAAPAVSLTEGPSIVLIEPPLIAFRDPVVPPADPEEVLGRVTAPAGLLDVLVLGNTVGVDDRGLFRFSLPADAGQVLVMAEDVQGLRSSVAFEVSPNAAAETGGTSRRPISFGRYVAVVIGNSDYVSWPRTPEAEEGAREIARVLEVRYGFLVRLLINANRVAVIRTLHELSKDLGEKDNLLIYFAGQGHLEGEWEDGYWLPVDAEPGRKDNWVPISEIIARANMIPARKTLVIADSAFRQMRSQSSLPLLPESREEREEWYRSTASGRSLVALTSGEWTQEREVQGMKGSVFNHSLATVLGTNNDVLETRRLRAEVAARMALVSADPFTEPECAGMRGHEAGDFLFVPE